MWNQCELQLIALTLSLNAYLQTSIIRLVRNAIDAGKYSAKVQVAQSFAIAARVLP